MTMLMLSRKIFAKIHCSNLLCGMYGFTAKLSVGRSKVHLSIQIVVQIALKIRKINSTMREDLTQD